MNRRGTVTIPELLRTELGGEGHLFEVVRREDGVIELRPRDPAGHIRVEAPAAAPPTQEQSTERERLGQLPFWLSVDADPAVPTLEQEQMEREADAAIAAGRVRHVDDVDSLVAHLEALSSPRA